MDRRTFLLGSVALVAGVKAAPSIPATPIEVAATPVQGHGIFIAPKSILSDGGWCAPTTNIYYDLAEFVDDLHVRYTMTSHFDLPELPQITMIRGCLQYNQDENVDDNCTCGSACVCCCICDEVDT